ncbi:MAG: CHC2 zinc finger domain-containing protein [Mollicutes bacterium]|nr:MAG: CHC2 zinc finger domain-containing protein [Mollicutes bacterium]
MINSKFGNIAEQINAKIGIFAIINEYINLKRKGKDYVALCPFHEDKHPSLLVSEKKQIFKCFSCNTGGGAVKFVMLYENLNYQKALKIISKKHQITIENFSYESQEHSEQTKKMLEIVQETHNFYKLQMLNPPLFLRKYLNKRKITPRIVEKYEIG